MEIVTQGYRRNLQQVIGHFLVQPCTPRTDDLYNLHDLYDVYGLYDLCDLCDLFLGHDLDLSGTIDP